MFEKQIVVKCTNSNSPEISKECILHYASAFTRTTSQIYPIQFKIPASDVCCRQCNIIFDFGLEDINSVTLNNDIAMLLGTVWYGNKLFDITKYTIN